MAEIDPSTKSQILTILSGPPSGGTPVQVIKQMSSQIKALLANGYVVVYSEPGSSALKFVFCEKKAGSSEYGIWQYNA